MTSITTRTPAPATHVPTVWRTKLARLGGAIVRFAESAGQHRAASELLLRADQYELTQPGFAAELRQAARTLQQRR
jgi:hypothetical protein